MTSAPCRLMGRTSFSRGASPSAHGGFHPKASRVQCRLAASLVPRPLGKSHMRCQPHLWRQKKSNIKLKWNKTCDKGPSSSGFLARESSTSLALDAARPSRTHRRRLHQPPTSNALGQTLLNALHSSSQTRSKRPRSKIGSRSADWRRMRNVWLPPSLVRRRGGKSRYGRGVRPS